MGLLNKKKITPVHKKTAFRRLGTLILWAGMIFFLLVALLIALLYVPPVQNWITGKAEQFLVQKLNTKVAVGAIHLNFAGQVEISDLYVEDQQQDTLLRGESVAVRISIFPLFRQQVILSDISLQGIKSKYVILDEEAGATNIDFIINAFSGSPPDSDSSESAWKVMGQNISLQDIDFLYDDRKNASQIHLRLNKLEIEGEQSELIALNFHLQKVHLQNASLFIKSGNTNESSANSATKVDTTGAGNGLFASVNHLTLENCNLHYEGTSEAETTDLHVGTVALTNLELDTEKSSVQSEAFSIADSQLAIATLSAEQDTTESTTAPVSLDFGWDVDLPTLSLHNNRFSLHQTPSDTLGTPFMIEVDNINLEATDLSARQDSLRLNVAQFAFYEKEKDINLQTFESALFLCNDKVEVQNLLLKTPHSQLAGDFMMQHPSLFSFSYPLEKLGISAEIHPSYIGKQDLQLVLPADTATLPAVNRIALETKMEGLLGDMAIHNFQANLDEEVFLTTSGNIKGLPEIEKTQADIEMNTRYRSRTGLQKIFAQNLTFDGILLPPFLTIAGNFKGSQNDFTSSFQLTSPVGNAEAQLRYQYVSAGDAFHGEIAFADVVPEKIYPAAAISNMQGKLQVSGTGIANQQYALQAEIELDSLMYGGYTYQHIALQGKYENEQGAAQMQVGDPFLQLTGEGKWKGEDSVHNFEANMHIEKANLHALQFANEPFTVKGEVASQIAVENQSFQLAADLRNLEILEDTRYQLSDMHLNAEIKPDFVKADARSRYVQGAFESNIPPAELTPLLLSHFKSYLSAKTVSDSVNTESYYQLAIDIDEQSSLGKLLPGVEDMKITSLKSTFNPAQEKFQFLMDIPYVKYEGIEADSLLFDIQSDSNSMKYLVRVPSVTQDQFSLKNLSFSGNLTEGKLINQISIQDSLQQDWYKIAFLLQGAGAGDIALSLVPGETILNYDAWSVNGENQIILKDSLPNEGALEATFQQQALGVRLDSGSVQIQSRKLPLSLFSALVYHQGSSALFSGILDGKVTVSRNSDSLLRADADVQVSDLLVMGTNIGYVEAKAISHPNERLEWLLSLKNENNTATLEGSYAYKETPLPLALQFDMDFRDLSVFQAFGAGEITELSGQVVSSVWATGNLENINASGRVNFRDAAFLVTSLNNRFSLHDEVITIDQAGLNFESFSIQDDQQNKFTVAGSLKTRDYQQFDADLNISGNKFTVINSTAEDNPTFFGDLIMSAKASVKGQVPDVTVRASLSVDDGTQLTYVMPASEINLISDEGIVEFIDPNRVASSDSLDMQDQVPDILLTKFPGLELAGNLNIHKNASFRIDVDPSSGDYATVKGEGQLNIGKSKGQPPSVTGSYKITEGIYEVSFYNMARKTFQIDNGSLLTWTGDPYNPLFDIQASYTTKAPSTGLVNNEIAGLSEDAKQQYKKLLPYEVNIFIKGNTLDTDLGFSIDLPEEDKLGYPLVSSKLQRLNEKGNETLLTQQVFGLLTIGSFIPESSTDVGADYGVAFASTAAFNSLNGILTNELNKLTGQYLKGVDIDFGLQSTQDIASGSQGMTTMMDVKVSKKLFNERMVVVAESSFNIQGNSNYSDTQNDIAIVYNLTEDKDYKLKAFNVSSYDVVYKDIRTSGISLIFVKEYDPKEYDPANEQEKKKKSNSNRKKKASGEQKD